MTIKCARCGAVATEIAADEQQATYRGGCRCFEIEWVRSGAGAGKFVVFGPNASIKNMSAASETAELSAK